MMESDEALDPYKPQTALKRQRRVKTSSSGKKVKLLLLFLFMIYATVVIMFIYKSAADNSYESMSRRFDESVSVVKAVNNQNRALKSEKEGLLSQSSALKEQFNNLKDENDKMLQMLEDLRKQCDELSRKNKELTKDNVALQNSLKAAAAVGIKPQNYTKFQGLGSRDDIERGNYLGRFLGTAYTPSAKECGNSKGITNSGKPIVPGVSLAVDGRYWPFGTVFYIRGLGYAVAMDSGGAIKGKNRFDFAVFDKKFAATLGSQYWDVYLVKKGTGKIGELEF